MKLKLLLAAVFCIFTANDALAIDAGLRYVNTRGKVICGTNLDAKTYAFKDEDGKWHGIDADLCRVFSIAFYGRSDRFELVNIYEDEAETALKSNKVDVLLGVIPYSASVDISEKVSPATLIYYDKQMFLARKIEGASSMEAYKEKKVCAVTNSADLGNIQMYSNRYHLDLKVLNFPSLPKAREAFLLKRCDLFSGNEIYLKGILKNYPGSTENVTILPEVISINPVYAFVEGENKTLRTTVKWVINSLFLAEERKINAANLNMVGLEEDVVAKNLIGLDPRLWKKFKLDADWVQKTIAEFGSFAEIYDRNLGKDSELNIERKENNLMENGGLINPQPFL